MPWFAALGSAIAGGASSAAGAIGAGASAAGSALASGASAVGGALGSAGSAIGSGLGSAASAIGSGASAVGSGIANAGYGIGNVAGGAFDALAGGGVHSAGGGVLSNMGSPAAAAPSTGSSGVLTSLPGTSGTPAPTTGGFANPFELSATDLPTWGQRTFGTNPIGQGIDQTLAVIDPRLSSPKLTDARIGMVKDFAVDKAKTGMQEQMNFGPAPSLPNRQPPVMPAQQNQQQASPYNLDAISRFNSRFGRGFGRMGGF